MTTHPTHPEPARIAVTSDILSLNPADTERLMRRLFGTPSAPVRPPATPLPPRPKPAPARRLIGSTTKPVALGDRVRMAADRREGIVIRMDGEKCLVLFGWEQSVWAGLGEFVRA